MRARTKNGRTVVGLVIGIMLCSVIVIAAWLGFWAAISVANWLVRL